MEIPDEFGDFEKKSLEIADYIEKMFLKLKPKMESTDSAEFALAFSHACIISGCVIAAKIADVPYDAMSEKTKDIMQQIKDMCLKSMEGDDLDQLGDDLLNDVADKPKAKGGMSVEDFGRFFKNN